MKRSLVCSAITACVFIAVLLLAIRQETSAATESGGGVVTTRPATGKAEQQKPGTPGDANTGHGPVIDGERFNIRQIIDHQQGGLPVGVFVAPEKWRDSSRVVWNYEHNSSPVSISMSAENPANEEAVFGYPAAQFFCLRPVSSYYRPGQNVGGLIFAGRQPPAQTLLAFIQRNRAGVSKLQFIGNKDLPELPAALQLPPSENQRGLGVKITYELNGKPVEEEFYAVAYSIDIPYDGPQGRTWQNNWGLNAPTVSVLRSAHWIVVGLSLPPSPNRFDRTQPGNSGWRRSIRIWLRSLIVNFRPATIKSLPLDGSADGSARITMR